MQRSYRAANTLAGIIFSGAATAVLAIALVSGLKGAPLVIMLFTGLGLFVISLQLFANAIFRSKRSTDEVIEYTIVDAIVALLR